MEHYVRHAPDHYTAAQALRYGEARGFGGGEELVREIAIGPLGQRIEHADFWRTVLSFFVAHTEMKREHVNPIVDCHFPNGSSLPLPRAKEGEERENYFVGRLPRMARSEPDTSQPWSAFSAFAFVAHSCNSCQHLRVLAPLRLCVEEFCRPYRARLVVLT